MELLSRFGEGSGGDRRFALRVGWRAMSDAATRAPAVGEPAPPLALPGLDGEDHDLSDLRGRPVLVSFLRHAG